MMMFTIAVLVAAGGALMLHRARLTRRVNTASPGSMSMQWIAEHRASHLS